MTGSPRKWAEFPLLVPADAVRAMRGDVEVALLVSTILSRTDGSSRATMADLERLTYMPEDRIRAALLDRAPALGVVVRQVGTAPVQYQVDVP